MLCTIHTNRILVSPKQATIDHVITNVKTYTVDNPTIRNDAALVQFLETVKREGIRPYVVWVKVIVKPASLTGTAEDVSVMIAHKSDQPSVCAWFAVRIGDTTVE